MELSAYIIIAVILFLIFGGMGWIIYKRYVKRAWYGSQYIGQNVYYQFQTKNKQESIEEAQYLEEDEKDEEFGGEGLK